MLWILCYCRFLRFGSTSGLFTSFFAKTKIDVKDASSYVISVKHRLEPILIEGIHIQGR